jgi:hypothetical protein
MTAPPTRRLRKCEWTLAGGRNVISPGEGTFSVMSVEEVAVSSPRSQSPSTACSFMPVMVDFYVGPSAMHRPAYRTARRAMGSGVGSAASSWSCLRLNLSNAVLRGLGHAALGRDLRAEVAWLHEHDVNAKRARL